jgi:hypothetical protein
MSLQTTQRPLLLPLTLASVLALAGCAGTGNGGSGVAGSAGRDATTEGAGLAAGLGVGLASGSPLIGLAVVVGVRYLTSTVLAYHDRSTQAHLQARIADAAGRSAPGDPETWTAVDVLGNRSWGRVYVTRVHDQGLPCRDIIYTEEDVAVGTVHYAATVCRSARGRWRWAVSEPSTERWRGLQ